MALDEHYLIVFYLLSLAVSVVTASLSTPRRRQPATFIFFALTIVVGIWSVFAVLQTGAQEPGLAMTFHAWDMAALTLVPSLFFLFVWFADRRPMDHRIFAVLLPALLFIAFDVGYPGTRLVWESAGDLGGVHLWPRKGPGYWLSLAMASAAGFAAIGVALRRSRREGGILKQWYRWLAFLACPPMAAATLRDLLDSNLRGFDPTPLAFTLTFLGLVALNRRYNPFDRLPLAKDALFDAMGEPLVLLASDGKVVGANRSAAALFGPGLTTRPRTGTITAVIDEKGRLTMAAAAEDRPLVLGGRSWMTTASPFTPGLGSSAEVLVLVRLADITDLEQARREIAEREAQLRIFDFMANSIEELVALVTLEGRLVATNGSFRLWFGLGQETERPPRLRDLVAAEDYEERILPALALVRGGERASYVATIARGDLGRRIFEMRWAPYRGAIEGGVSHALMLGQDITAFVDKQKELMAATERAEAANRAKDNFLAAMSHELRTPLNAIIGLTDLALHTRLEDKTRHDLGLALDASHRLLAIVNDVLDLTKIQAGRMSLEVVDFDPGAQAEGIVRSFEAMAMKKGLSLAFRRGEGLPPVVRGDPLRFGQILGNLLSNAIKFTLRGGVEARLSADGPGDGEDGRVPLRIEVSDTGIGIEADKVDLVFQDFAQVDAGTSRRFGGTGLGLGIVKRLAEAYGGSVSVRSEARKGSTFSVLLRLARGFAAAQPLSAMSDIRAARTPLDILVVEDDEVNAIVALSYLERAGHRPQRVASGEDAIELLSRSAFDLVLMDIQMPGIDGFEATKRIRGGASGAGAASTPIVAMTAHAISMIREELAESGMDGHIEKPIIYSELAASVTKYTGRSIGAGKPAPAGDRVAELLPMEGAEVVDLEGALSRMGGDGDLLREVIGIFSSEATTRLRDIEAAVEAGDRERLRRAAHTVRGAARNLGAEALSRAAEALEKAALELRSEDFASLAASVANEYRLALDALAGFPPSGRDS